MGRNAKIKHFWEKELSHLAKTSSKCFCFSRCLHGKCTAAGAAYTCKCMEGYTGTYCDKKNNSSNLCRTLKCSHGQCKVSEHGEPYCECDPGYSGELCDRGRLAPGSVLLHSCFTPNLHLLYTSLPCRSDLGKDGK